MKRNIITIILALAAVCSTWAQTQREIELSGSVEDGFLKIPLSHAKVSVCRADSSVLVDSAAIFTAYNRDLKPLFAKYTTKVTTDAKELLVHARLKGYDDVWQRVSIGKQTEVEVPTLEMRKMREVDLGEVIVKATRVKMFYRGDTIVYDATAFKLPQGSMLDDLIRQMPGVTLNEAGQIFVNGRMVDELMLGSRSFMKGNKKVLMENLPYYTVKDIKVYDRQSDKSMALGYDVDPKKFVMDVNLKEEYQRGYIANVEGAVGTEDRWLGRAFLLGFTDRLRLTLFGNVNNVNESRHIGQSGHWTPASMPQSMVTIRSAATEIDYHTKGDKVKETFSADYTSTTDEQEMRQRYEQFLAGSTPLSISAMRNRSGNRQVKLHNNLSVSKPLYLGTELEFNYATRDGSFNSSFDQWNDSLTASKRTVGMSEGKAWNVKADIGGAVNVEKNKQHVDYHFTFAHNYDESQQASRYLTEQFTSDSRQLTHNTSDIYNRQTIGFVNLGYGMPLGKDVRMFVIEQAQIVNRRTHDYLYHPDSLLLPSEIDMLTAITDPSNSYDSHSRMFENSASVSFYQTAKCKPYPDLPMSMEYQRWDIALTLPVRHERLDYERGMIDTVATQNTVFLNASASMARRQPAAHRPRGKSRPEGQRDHECQHRLLRQERPRPSAVVPRRHLAQLPASQHGAVGGIRPCKRRLYLPSPERQRSLHAEGRVRHQPHHRQEPLLVVADQRRCRLSSLHRPRHAHGHDGERGEHCPQATSAGGTPRERCIILRHSTPPISSTVSPPATPCRA